MTSVSLVGSTGSIGTQAIDVVRADPGAFEVVALGADPGSRPLLFHGGRYAALHDED